MTQLTFKQYLDGREQLLQAIKNTPIAITEYEITKYCTIPIGENDEEKELISLRPKQRIIIEWQYDDVHHPTPMSIRFIGPKNVEENEKHSLYWDDRKLEKFLQKHASKLYNNGYKS